MLELRYPTVTKTILECQYPGKPTLKVAFGNGNGAIFENSSKLRVSLFVTSRWPRTSGQTNYQVHHPAWSYLLWEKYCNFPLTTTRGDRFASCENIVSRSQTSSLPPPRSIQQEPTTNRKRSENSPSRVSLKVSLLISNERYYNNLQLH